MLSQQQELPLSEYSSLYDIVVPQDNLLRRINDLVDFTFVYQELANKYCKDNGRTAESPIRMASPKPACLAEPYFLKSR